MEVSSFYYSEKIDMKNFKKQLEDRIGEEI